MTAEPDHSAVRPMLRPDYSPEQLAQWLQRHQSFVARAREGGIDVAFFGDSLTDGWRNQGGLEWERHFAPLRAANFGLSGDRTQQVLWRMEHGELEGYAAQVVVLLIGTNNFDHGLGTPSLTPRNSPVQIAEGVARILRLLHRRMPSARVLLHGLLPRGACNAPVRQEIASVNGLLAGLANGTRVRFIDLSATFLARDGSIRPEYTNDLLHLTAAGYTAWAARLHGPVHALAAEPIRTTPVR